MPHQGWIIYHEAGCLSYSRKHGGLYKVDMFITISFYYQCANEQMNVSQDGFVHHKCKQWFSNCKSVYHHHHHHHHHHFCRFVFERLMDERKQKDFFHFWKGGMAIKVRNPWLKGFDCYCVCKNYFRISTLTNNTVLKHHQHE